MPHLLKIILISSLLLTITITGDYFIKRASSLKEYEGWHLLFLGAFLNFAAATGWFWIYRSQKFLTVGAILSIGLITLSILVSQFIFKEKINNWEIFGLVLGFISLTILLKNGNL